MEALASPVDHAPGDTDTDVPVDHAVLRTIATAIHDVEWFRFDYRDDSRLVEPYRLLAWKRRWYLVARDPAAGDWDVFRAD